MTTSDMRRTKRTSKVHILITLGTMKTKVSVAERQEYRMVAIVATHCAHSLDWRSPPSPGGNKETQTVHHEARRTVFVDFVVS